jgi:hypothetical protein
MMVQPGPVIDRGPVLMIAPVRRHGPPAIARAGCGLAHRGPCCRAWDVQLPAARAPRACMGKAYPGLSLNRGAAGRGVSIRRLSAYRCLRGPCRRTRSLEFWFEIQI